MSNLRARTAEERLRWTHAIMQEFVNEVQQHLSAGRTRAAALMFEKNLSAGSAQAPETPRCDHRWTIWHAVGDLPNGVIVEERQCMNCRIYEARDRASSSDEQAEGQR
jgi:hypothetical protein